jgi:uncharacterized protein (DUF433 family)
MENASRERLHIPHDRLEPMPGRGAQRRHGVGCVACEKGHRVRCEDITGQFEAGCSAEEIAGPDIYPGIPLAVVCRVLRFAYRSELDAIRQAGRKWTLPPTYQRRADELARKLADIDRALRPRPTRKALSQ